MRSEQAVDAFESFVKAAQQLGFATGQVTILEEDGIFWLLIKNLNGSYSDTLFPRLLGTSKSAVVKTLRAYTGALNAVIELRKSYL
jgi:hypothetical protein